MLEIKHTEVWGLNRSLKASGNPMSVGEINTVSSDLSGIERGRKLGSVESGTGHDNFLKGIHVQFDIKYPQYWTPEAQRYHWFEIISSQSKMHRLTTMGKSDEFNQMFNKYVDEDIINKIKLYVEKYNASKNEDEKYLYFMKSLSNMPLGFELWMTVDLTYLQIKTMYQQRKNHKLKEDWSVFCNWALELPEFKNIVLGEE